MGNEATVRHGAVIFKDISIIVNPLGEVLVCRCDGNKYLEHITLSDSQQLMDLHVAITKYFGGEK
jgi:hypothetical protein